MKNYHIFVRSNENPRTINTPCNGRTYYTLIVVKGWEALENKVAELLSAGEKINEIATELGTRYYVTKAGKII